MQRQQQRQQSSIDLGMFAPLCNAFGGTLHPLLQHLDVSSLVVLEAVSRAVAAHALKEITPWKRAFLALTTEFPQQPAEMYMHAKTIVLKCPSPDEDGSVVILDSRFFSADNLPVPLEAPSWRFLCVHLLGSVAGVVARLREDVRRPTWKEGYKLMPGGCGPQHQESAIRRYAVFTDNEPLLALTPRWKQLLVARCAHASTPAQQLLRFKTKTKKPLNLFLGREFLQRVRVRGS